VPGTASNTARVAWVCAAAAVVFVVWLVLPASATAGAGFFYAVPIGLASWWGGRRVGAIAVAGCVLLYVLSAAIEPVPDPGLALAVRLLAFVGVAAIVTALRERLLVLEHSVEELEAIRAALTPSTLPQQPGVDAAAAFIPSEFGVSGDFYLLTNGPDGSTLAIVGDVVGHGPRAARLATFLSAQLAALAANTSDPAELLTLANGTLLDRPGRRRELVSAVCLRLQDEDRRLSWAIAGHPPPLRLPGLQELAGRGNTFLLGASAHPELAIADTGLDDGGGVVLYTDGATDVRREGALLGLAGLTDLLAPLSDSPARVIVEEAEAAILDWADEPIRDDLCLLVLKPR
jgi:serine phosphatase RsbU (regulator of sigma subunit)